MSTRLQQPLSIAPILCVLATLLTACPKPPPLLKTGLEEPEKNGPTNPLWTTKVPAEFHEVRLHAHDDCLFLTAVKGTQALAPRVQLCLDPETAEVKWAEEVAVEKSANKQDRFFTTTRDLIYVNRGQALARQRTNGEVSWQYSDPQGLPIYGAFLEGDTLVMSLANRKLALVDVSSGQLRAGYEMQDQALKGVVTTPTGLVALTASIEAKPRTAGTNDPSRLPVASGSAGPRLTAIPIGAEGPEAPQLTRLPAPRWSAEISTLSFDLSVIDGVAYGEFHEGVVEALNVSTGERVWRRPASSPAGEVISTSSALLLHSTSKEGLRVSRVSATALETAAWTLTVPEASRLFGVEERREDPRIFGATRASFFQFHSQSGALLWHIPFISEENPSDWTNASSNGDAVFVYFDVPGSEGVLKRIPIINTEHN